MLSAIKITTAVMGHVLGMHPSRKGMSVLWPSEIKVMRQQYTLLAPLVNRKSNAHDQSDEYEYKQYFHQAIILQRAAFSKFGARPC